MVRGWGLERVGYIAEDCVFFGETGKAREGGRGDMRP